MTYEPLGYTEDELAELTRTEGVWFDNSVQFPRLLAEISATQSKLDYAALCASMDLEPADIDARFERAEDAWELITERGL